MKDTTKVKIRVPKALYESIQAQLDKKQEPKMEIKDKEEKEPISEMGVEDAWIPAAAAGLGIVGSLLQGIVAHMKKKNLKGMKGFLQAYKEVGGEAKDTIGSKMSGNMEEGGMDKKEEPMAEKKLDPLAEAIKKVLDKKKAAAKKKKEEEAKEKEKASEDKKKEAEKKEKEAEAKKKADAKKK